MTDNIASVFAQLEAASTPKDSSVAGGGLINTQWSVDNTQRSLSYTPVDMSYTTLFSPATSNYTIPIITISGSSVTDTGNTSTAQPINYTTSAEQSASPQTTQGGNTGGLTELVIPLALIAGAAVVGVTVIDVISGTKGKK